MTEHEEPNPTEQIQLLREQQKTIMLELINRLANTEGITLDEIDWPYLVVDEDQQRYRAAVSFWLP